MTTHPEQIATTTALLREFAARMASRKTSVNRIQEDIAGIDQEAQLLIMHAVFTYRDNAIVPARDSRLWMHVAIANPGERVAAQRRVRIIMDAPAHTPLLDELASDQQ